MYTFYFSIYLKNKEIEVGRFDKFKNTFISLDELNTIFSYDDYLEFYENVCNAIKAGEIAAIKNSRLNGKTPALHTRYRIIKKEKDNKELLDELKYKISVDFHIDYYQKHIEKYKQHRKYILQLNDFILNRREKLDIPISMNERAFQIWSKEKFLQKGEGKTILKNLGLDEQYLNYYDTSEPLAYYSISREIPQKVLIIENKDTYYTMRKYLISGGKKILGQDISTIVYGSGKNINKAFKDFELSVEEYVSNKNNQILYFGDLDYEGIIIYESLYELINNKYNISPFIDGYKKMIDKAEKSNINLAKTKDGQNRNIENFFLSCFTEEYAEKIMAVLERDLYIPQEIININDL